MGQEALSRAVTGQSLTNWPAIIAGFTARGIPESDVRPRENVFTYHAWRALGRQVRRGEHGVKVVTFVSVRGKEDKDGIATNDVDGTDKPKRGAHRRPWTATVFHVSQTDPLEADRAPIGHAATRACENSGL
jgi:antirestriction protein ArdC